MGRADSQTREGQASPITLTGRYIKQRYKTQGHLWFVFFFPSLSLAVSWFTFTPVYVQVSMCVYTKTCGPVWVLVATTVPQAGWFKTQGDCVVGLYICSKPPGASPDVTRVASHAYCRGLQDNRNTIDNPPMPLTLTSLIRYILRFGTSAYGSTCHSLNLHRAVLTGLGTRLGPLWCVATAVSVISLFSWMARFRRGNYKVHSSHPGPTPRWDLQPARTYTEPFL